MNIQTLNAGFQLHSPTQTYTIKKVLGHGAFGITYLASARVIVHGSLGEIETQADVCIKEFFMPDFHARSDKGVITSVSNSELPVHYGNKFKTEALNLSHLSHPNIVKVLEVFDANASHYYVMEYIDGETLDEYTLRKGGLSENEALGYIKTAATALCYMHSQNMLHLDVKPKNIMRRSSDGRIFLIDFGLSKQYKDTGEAESSTAIGLGTPGYAPLEQSDGIDTKSFPVTIDIYSLGGTLFKLLTAQTPPKASEIINDGLPIGILSNKNISEKTVSFIENTMQPLKKNRPQNMVAVLSMLSDDDESTIYEHSYNDGVAIQEPKKIENTQNSQQKLNHKKMSLKKIFLSVAIMCLSLIIIFIGVAIQKESIPNESIITSDTLNKSSNVVEKSTSYPVSFTDEGNKSFSFEGTLYDNGDPKKGTAKYEDGRTYKGSFVNKLPDGEYGIMTQKNGDVYEGSFSKGFYKKGRYTSKSDGYYFEGTFKEGNPYNGTWSSPNGEVDTKIINGK